MSVPRGLFGASVFHAGNTRPKPLKKRRHWYSLTRLNLRPAPRKGLTPGDGSVVGLIIHALRISQIWPKFQGGERLYNAAIGLSGLDALWG
jgi:hypothetical protein